MVRSSENNLILRTLRAAERTLLEPHLVHVDLAYGMVLEEYDDPVHQVFFVETGIVSLVVVLNDGATVEAGIVGFEGVIGAIDALTRSRFPGRAVVQGPGTARRIDAQTLRELAPQLPQLRELVDHARANDLRHAMQTAACNATHTIPRRLARWLLLVHDRVAGDQLALTHEFLGDMLAVHRPSITVAMRELQSRGAIRYKRGKILVTNRAALEEAACECYEAIQSWSLGEGGAPTALLYAGRKG